MANPAPGEMSLNKLISSMNASLSPPTYVFLTLPSNNGDTLLQSLRRAEMLFREDEGWTVIMTQEDAESIGLISNDTFRCRKITLNVHSSLDAVGFIAAVATRLASLGMGVNPVSGYYHDHLFVPVGKEDAAMSELRAMAAEQHA
ncbi:hypothetical protein BAUCODRAFT_24547 [Baudoinia panamericana UAMH 10762]|uniref:DUF2241 domain-containing protein n=1 Tax=Baudoinia panamericana (strain UAMH 10762) TaxID=717646 RepID=M2LQZ3_BAUPA|nr:uncharacterized protein BAUCODRAFT_24547 [Baudoinia panamericana UAMH 10762]EMC96852.1 hypothetical protein BAUCODRAFT_24547 [Baudoinia panamericana UAMH 10762]